MNVMNQIVIHQVGWKHVESSNDSELKIAKNAGITHVFAIITHMDTIGWDHTKYHTVCDHITTTLAQWGWQTSNIICRHAFSSSSHAI